MDVSERKRAKSEQFFSALQYKGSIEAAAALTTAGSIPRRERPTVAAASSISLKRITRRALALRLQHLANGEADWSRVRLERHGGSTKLIDKNSLDSKGNTMSELST